MNDAKPVHLSKIYDVSADEASQSLVFPFWRFAALLLPLIALIGFFGYLNYRHQITAAEQAAYRHIEAIGNLKAAQIAHWLHERRGDAKTLYDSRLGAGLQAFLSDPGGAAEQRQRHPIWLQSLRENYNYHSVVLLNAESHVVLSVPEADPGIAPETRAFIEQARRSQGVVFSDLYQTGATPAALRLDFVVPLLTDREQVLMAN